jgi:geranylgeranyl diphosphate synthase type II
MQLQDFRQLFLDYMETHRFSDDPQSLYEPVDYIMQLGGKRLRPLLALVAHQMFQPDPQPALPVAMAVEVFHNFSLVHDDIMDAAPVRRGKPSVHAKYDTNTAILSGDVMLIYAYRFLSQLEDPAVQARVIAVFNQVAIEVCEGQQYDVDFEQRADVTIPEYIKMIEFKTAALMAGSLVMGAIVGGAGEADLMHLDAFGRKIGIAFQIQDDLLDTFGDPEKFGKKVGGDIVQNKKTLLILQALDRGNATQKAHLSQQMNTPTTNEAEKIAQVKGLLEELDIPGSTRKLRDQYRQEALAHLDAVGASSEAKKPLYELAGMLVEREV